MHNGQYRCYINNPSRLHTPPTKYHLLAAQQEPCGEEKEKKEKKKRKAYLLRKIPRIFFEKSQENGPLAEENNDVCKEL